MPAKSFKFKLVKLPAWFGPLFWWLVILSINSYQLSQPMLAETDAFSRASSALDKHISHNHTIISFFTNAIWLPGFFSIMNLAQDFFGQSILTLRATVLVIQSLAVLPLWKISIWLNKRLKAGDWYPWLVLGLFTINPLRAILATATLTEPIFLTILLFSIAAWLPSKTQSPVQRWLASLITLAWLFLAQSIRFEAWYLIPFWWWLILSEPLLKKPQKWFLILLTILYPVIAMANQYFLQSHNFEFSNTQYLQANVNVPLPGEYYRIFPSIWRVIQPTLTAFSFSGVILGLLGSFLAWKLVWKNKPAHQPPYDWASFLTLWLLPSSFVLMLIFQVFAGLITGIYLRYFLMTVILGLPWISFGIIKLGRWLKLNWWPGFFPGIIIILGIFSIESGINWFHRELLIAPHLSHPNYADIKLISEFLIQNLPISRPKFIGDPAIFSSKLPKVWLFGPKDPSFPFLTGLTYLMSQNTEVAFNATQIFSKDWAIIPTNQKIDLKDLPKIIVKLKTPSYILIQKL